MKPHPDWIAFKLFTELSLEDMDKLAKQAGFTIHSPFITDEQAARFNTACLEAGLRCPMQSNEKTS